MRYVDEMSSSWSEANLWTHDSGTHVDLLAVGSNNAADGEPLGPMETNSNYIMVKGNMVIYTIGNAETAREKSAGEIAIEGVGFH